MSSILFGKFVNFALLNMSSSTTLIRFAGKISKLTYWMWYNLNMKNKKIFLVFSVVVLVFAIGFSAFQVFGASWTPPTNQFPAGNTMPPIDEGGSPQTKEAYLGAGTFESNALAGAGFTFKDKSYLKSGANAFYLSSNGNSMLLNSTSPFLLYTRGLTLPPYSPTLLNTILGSGVPEGTLTYYDGEVWVYTGAVPPPPPPPPPSQGSFNEGGILNKLGFSFNKSSAAGVGGGGSGQGWVSLSGGGTISTSTITNIVNNYLSSIINNYLTSYWIKQGSTIYNDEASSTTVQVRNFLTVTDKAAIRNSAAYGDSVLTLGSPVGMTEPINIHIGGDQVISDNAYYQNGWKFNSGGDDRFATAIMVGRGTIRFAVSSNRSGGGVSQSEANWRSKLGLSSKEASAQSGGTVQWKTGLYLDKSTGIVNIPTSLNFEPQGSGGEYMIKNVGGTVGFHPNNGAASLTIGQDGALGIKERIISRSGKISLLGSTETSNKYYSYIDYVYTQPSQAKCACDINQETIDCWNTSVVPPEDPGVQCYDKFNAMPNSPPVYQWHIYKVEGSVLDQSILEVGGQLNSQFKKGLLKLKGVASGYNTIIYGDETGGKGILKIARQDDAGNMDKILKIDLTKFPSSGSNVYCNTGQFLTINMNGELVCGTPSGGAVPPPSSGQFYYTHIAVGTEETSLTIQPYRTFCALNRVDIGSTSIGRGRCRVEYDNNAGRWKLYAYRSDNNFRTQCGAICF